MRAALALPVALVLGVVAELVGGVVRAAAGERPWHGRLSAGWADLRRLWGGDPAERVSPVETLGAAAAMLGGGLAAAAALGFGPGSLPLVYLSLALAAVGAHATAVEPPTRTGEARSLGRRRLGAAVEPVFLVAVAAAFLRWGTTDLEAVRGAQTVLGPGVVLGPPVALAGLALAAAGILGAGALRLVPSPDVRRGRRRPAGGALAIRLSRWSVAGATAALVGVLVAGGGLVPGATPVRLAAAGGAMVGAAAVLGAAAAALDLLGDDRRAWLAVAGAAVAASGAAALVAVA